MIRLAISAKTDLLGNFALKAAREAGPNATAEGAVLIAQVHRGKAHDLAQVVLALAVDSSESLPHYRSEEVGLAVFEVFVVLLVLVVVSIALARVR